MTASLLSIGGWTNCRYAITWWGLRIHRRRGDHLWCDESRCHGGPPNPDLLASWPRCEKCFPRPVGVPR